MEYHICLALCRGGEGTFHAIVLVSQNEAVRSLGGAGNFVPVAHTKALEVESGPEPGSPGSPPQPLTPLPLWGFLIQIKYLNHLHLYSLWEIIAIIFVPPHKEIIRIK